MNGVVEWPFYMALTMQLIRIMICEPLGKWSKPFFIWGLWKLWPASMVACNLFGVCTSTVCTQVCIANRNIGHGCAVGLKGLGGLQFPYENLVSNVCTSTRVKQHGLLPVSIQVWIHEGLGISLGILQLCGLG